MLTKYSSDIFTPLSIFPMELQYLFMNVLWYRGKKSFCIVNKYLYMLIQASLNPINCQNIFKKCPTLFIIWFDSQKTYWILKERNVSQCDAVTYFVSSLCMWKVTISLLLRKKAFDILINLWWKRTFTALLKHIFFKIIIVFLFFKQEKNGFE